MAKNSKPDAQKLLEELGYFGAEIILASNAARINQIEAEIKSLGEQRKQLQKENEKLWRSWEKTKSRVKG